MPDLLFVSHGVVLLSTMKFINVIKKFLMPPNNIS